MLTMQDIADRLGIDRASVQKYRTRGELPPADQMIGRTPVWRPATVERWIRRRPGAPGQGRGRRPGRDGASATG